MRDRAARIRDRLGVTFLHVTGNEQEALAMGDTVPPCSTAAGSPRSARPQTLSTTGPARSAVARFLNCYNLFEGTVGDGAFRFAEAALPLPGEAAAGGEPPMHPHDRMTVRRETEPAAPGEVALARPLHRQRIFRRPGDLSFDVAGSRPVEVESHLSHRRPGSFDPGRRYALRWPAADALVFREGRR